MLVVTALMASGCVAPPDGEGDYGGPAAWMAIGGSLDTILVEGLQATGESTGLLLRPDGEGLSIDVNTTQEPIRLRINLTYLEGMGIARPAVHDEGGSFVYARQDVAGEYLVVPAVPNRVHVRPNAALTIHESRALMGIASFDEGGFRTVVPLVSEFRGEGFRLQLLGLPWDDLSREYSLAAVNLTADGTELAGRNRTHYATGNRAVEESTIFDVAPGAIVDELVLEFRDETGVVRERHPLPAEGADALFISEALHAGPLERCRTIASAVIMPMRELNATISTNAHTWGAAGWHQTLTVGDTCQAAPRRELDASAGFVVHAATKVIGTGYKTWSVPLAFGGNASSDGSTGPVGAVAVGGPTFMAEIPRPLQGDAIVAYGGLGLIWPMEGCPPSVGSVRQIQHIFDFLPMARNETIHNTDCRARPTAFPVSASGDAPPMRAILLPLLSAERMQGVEMFVTWVADGPDGEHRMGTGWKMMTTVNAAFTACPTERTCAPHNQADVYVLHVDDAVFRLHFGAYDP